MQLKSVRLKAARLACLVALIYVGVAGGWFLVADALVKFFVTGPDARVQFSRYLDWSFVVLTGALLYLVLRRSLSRWETEAVHRKRAEAAQLETEERYRLLFAVSTDAIILMDCQTRQILEVNPAAETMYGYSREEFLQLKATEISAEPEPARIALAGEEIQMRLQMHRRKDGTAFPVEISGSAFAFQSRRIEVAFMRDITGRMKSEAQLRKLSRTVEQTPMAVIITDVAGTIEYVNQAFTRLTGYPAEEAVGNNPRMLKSGDVPGDTYQDLWATITAGQTWSGELHNRKKNGELFWEQATISPLLDQAGKVTHYIAIKEDITRRRQLETQLRQAQKLEAIGTLAGGVAHEFNNILAAVLSCSQLLQQDTAGNPAAQQNIDEILKAASRAKDLVQQILSFSQQREQKRQVIPLTAVLTEVTTFLRASLPAEINVDLHLAADAPDVLADPGQIYQVMINLATNAMHAMAGQPGRLAVTLDLFQPGENFIREHPEFRPGQYARVAVADTGYGMDAQIMERMFEPFFTTKPVGKGTGLGLSEVHGIVRSHEGFITVESRPGLGATFWLYFPAQTDRAPLTGAGPADVATGPGRKILLVDDEVALTAPFQQLLQRLKYQVTVSNSPREAIGLFRAHPDQFALVITDLTMPEMTGLEMAHQLHAIRPDVPVILVSGFASGLSHEKLREAGICELIEKPVSMTDLADAVQRHYPRIN